MSILGNVETVTQTIRDGLHEFAAKFPSLRPARAVVWFEPEHESCALYISTDGHSPKLLPSEFDFQNFAVADIVVEPDYENRREEFWKEAERIVRELSGVLPSGVNPSLWAVQVGFDFFVEWQRPNAHGGSISKSREAAEPGATDNPDDAQRLREDR